LATNDILALILLVAKILVANEKVPTCLNFPSQILPRFWQWAKKSLANFLAC
jgi:hypothetical protein